MIGDLGVSNLLVILFLATPFGVLIYMFLLFWTRARDSEPDSISVQYGPPDNLTPSECGTLVDDAVGLCDITATLTDLSVKGYLAIEQDHRADSPIGQQGYIFHLTKAPSDWDNLRPHEREVLKCIFVSTNPLQILSAAMSQLQNAVNQNALKIRSDPGGLLGSALSSAFSRVQAKTKEASEVYGSISGAGDGPQMSVDFSELQSHFSLQLPNIRNAIFDQLVSGGYYEHRPDLARIRYALKGVFLGLLMAFVGGVLAHQTGTAPADLILPGLLTGAIVLIFGWLLPARTSKGLRTLAKVLGFREFLRRVEKDHIERLEKTPELFEKYLPYAMALKVEKTWTQAFARISVPPPKWYQGEPGEGFLPLHLVNDLTRMSSQPGRELTPSPPSSGEAGNPTDSDSNA